MDYFFSQWTVTLITLAMMVVVSFVQRRYRKEL